MIAAVDSYDIAVLCSSELERVILIPAGHDVVAAAADQDIIAAAALEDVIPHPAIKDIIS